MHEPLETAHVHPHTRAGATAVIEHGIEERLGFVEVYDASRLDWLADAVYRLYEPPCARSRP